MNNDFSSEWFDCLNHYLNQMDCEIFDVKVGYDMSLFKASTYPHINSESTYYRYFIEELFSEGKALYLDCDLVVTGSLNKLWQIDLQDNYISACIDILEEQQFNAGVMLINCHLWAKENIKQQAVALTEQLKESLTGGDQEVLNQLFKGRWLTLPWQYNYLAGAEAMLKFVGRTDKIKRKANEIPLIIHYNTMWKPWLPYYDLPLREIYWFYYQLEWQTIIQQSNK